MEDFDDGDFDGWSVVDEAPGGSSAWSVSANTLVQSNNLWGGSTSPAALPKPGTYLRYDGGDAWSDYRVSFTLRSQDNDALGLMFRVQGAQHYYRFSWDRQRGYQRLVKNDGGVFSLLAENNVGYEIGRSYLNCEMPSSPLFLFNVSVS